MVINTHQYSALNFSIAIILLIWLGHSLAGFSTLNGFAYDFFLRNHLKPPVSEQLLVLDGEKQYAERGDEVWLPLLKNLLMQDVKLIVFNFLPEKASADFYQLAADSGKVVFGRHIAASDSYSPPKLQALPSGAKGKNIIFGAVAAVPNQGGIYRTQHRIVDIDGQHLDSLEYRVAQTLSNEPTENPDDFLINFIGGTGLIPKAKLDQAVAGNLVKELMKGRTVLVGVYGVEPLASYFTPISTANQQTPALLYHAFGLDTLLAKKTISILTDVWMLMLIAIVTVTSLIFCQQLNFQHSLSLSIGFSLAYMLACWLILQSLLIWIPPIALLIAQWLMFGVAWRQRIVQEHKLLDSMLFNLSVNLQEKAFPVSFFYSQDPWGELITLITQSLHVNRMIFLERVPEDHRLKEIKAYNCNINDVSERRRDFERTPYSTAIEEQKPILLDKPYLTALDNEEQHYLAPLIFAGDILGFWAFTIIPSEVRASQKFHDLTQAFMKQISEILFYRQQWESQERQNKKNILTYLTLNSGTPSYQMLSKSLALLDKRIGELQQVFNSLNTGGVLYDLFGRVLLLNNTMEELAKSENLRLYNLTAMDFIAAVTGYDSIEAKDIMQRAIFDKETLSLPVTHFKAGRDYILHIHPLQLEDTHQLTNPNEQVFEIIGILCELEDVTELKAIYRLKEQMFERFNFQMRNDFASMVFALSILEDTTTSTDDKAFALYSIKGKIDETLATLATLESVNKQMSINVENLAESLGSYPINAQVAIKEAVTHLSDYATLRSIRIHLTCPRLLSLVLASPNELNTSFHALLTLMINDTFEGADLWIAIEEKNEWVTVFFRNNGIGIASNTLEQSPGPLSPLSTEELKIHEVISWVNYWEGRIEFFSQLGKGSTVTLMLKRFL